MWFQCIVNGTVRWEMVPGDMEKELKKAGRWKAGPPSKYWFGDTLTCANKRCVIP